MVEVELLVFGLLRRARRGVCARTALAAAAPTHAINCTNPLSSKNDLHIKKNTHTLYDIENTVTPQRQQPLVPGLVDAGLPLLLLSVKVPLSLCAAGRNISSLIY